MKHLPLILLISALCFSLPGRPLARQAPHAIPPPDGPGNLTCGQWTTARRDADANTVSDAKRAGRLTFSMGGAYIQGFVSGVSFVSSLPVARAGQPDFMPTDIDTQNAWVDNFCRNNALDNLTVVAGMLAIELKAKKFGVDK